MCFEIFFEFFVISASLEDVFLHFHIIMLGRDGEYIIEKKLLPDVFLFLGNRRILFAILAVGSLALVATGCEKKENKAEDTTTTTTTAAEKKLTCEMDEEDDGVKENIKYAYSWNGDKMEKVTLTMARIYKDKYDEKDYKDAADECKKLLDSPHKGFTCNAQASGSRIYVTYSFTLADLDEDSSKIAKDAGVDEMKDLTYDKVKSTLETATFTCK